MKRILITGKNSYVGTKIDNWISRNAQEYIVETLDMIGDYWKEKSFSEFNTIIHVAGIAHVKERNIDSDLYYKVNRDLTFHVANKAKSDGVKHFIFLSSMSVYGIEEGIIDEQTIPSPNTHYGKSKLEAENLILTLKDEKFEIAIVRPPMIYGPGCKGNYPKLSDLAKKIKVFPDFENERSMIFIDNFCQAIKLIIDGESSGVFFPQNLEYVKTTELVKSIAKIYKRKIFFTKIFNPFIRLFKIGPVKKVFGNLTYKIKMSAFKEDYNVTSFNQSVIESEKMEV